MAEKVKRKKRKWLRLMMLLVILAIGLPLLAIGIAGPMAKPAQADVIVVPGAALRKGGRELSEVLQSRMDHAIYLWGEGFAPKLVLAGGGEGNDNEARAMARYAIAHGVPKEAILLETSSRTTRENADQVAELLGKIDASKALVVSNWYHVARVRLALEQAGISTLGSAADKPGELSEEAKALGREWFGLWAYVTKIDGLRS